jgi:hypothetical protein
MSTAGTLTIKHVEEGREGIVQAIRVEHEWGKPGDGNGAKLTAYGVPGEGGPTLSSVETYASGTIYVMNESGATVGKYVLSD